MRDVLQAQITALRAEPSAMDAELLTAQRHAVRLREALGTIVDAEPDCHLFSARIAGPGATGN